MIIKDWQSKEKYDNKLIEKIYHYQIHPEMLPYVGELYDDVKILLVGESHYLCTEFSKYSDDNIFKKYVKERWYGEPVPKGFPNEHYFNTRRVVHNFLVERRSRAHSIFRNPAKGIIEALDLKDVTDSEAFSACAFMNYFQRPALISGESIEDNPKDRKESYKVFKHCQEILKPDITIFLSKKAFAAYDESAGDKADNVYCVMHPTCSHWNRMNGRERFVSIIQKHVSTKSIDHSVFEQSQKIRYEDIKFSEKFTNVVRRKKFDADNICVQVRGAHKSINEIVIYFTDGNDKKYGIGFVVRYGYIWIWDYDNKRYVSEEELNENQTIKDNYDCFKSWIGIL